MLLETMASVLLAIPSSNVKWSIDAVNERISRELCTETLHKISDAELLPVYRECTSVKSAADKLRYVLTEEQIPEPVQENILNKYILELVPPGTKGVIRGNKFNHIVEEFVTGLNLPVERFEVKFEKKHEKYITTEIPDWYVYDKQQDKIMIGMNQLDLWGGGQQLNRGFKYLKNNPHNTENSKLVCVVANEQQFKYSNNKAFEVFTMGFENDTLCYMKNLKNIIFQYFDVSRDIVCDTKTSEVNTEGIEIKSDLSPDATEFTPASLLMAGKIAEEVALSAISDNSTDITAVPPADTVVYFN